MLKSLSEFRSLGDTELAEIVGKGPLLVTQDEEPRFVAQSIDAFEAMVRRLRELEFAAKCRSSRQAQIHLLRR
jgi:hypothetical protein